MHLPYESRPRAPLGPMAVLLIVAPLACFKADDGADEIGDTGSETATDSTEGETTTTDSTDDDPSTTETDSTDAPETDSTDTTTGPEPACNDGSADPGELCLADTPTETALPFPALRCDVGRFGVNPGLAIVGGANAPAAAIVLPGNGDRTFAMPMTIALDSFALSIDVGDMDGDGDHDFVTHGGMISSRVNDSQGGFELPDVYDPGGLGTDRTRIQLGQFDGNMPLDVVWGDGYNTDWVRGNPFQGWTFGQQGTGQYTGGDSWVEVTEWGFDGDAFTDLAVTSQWSPDVAVLRGMGNATFAQHSQVPICDMGQCDITELHVDDVDADGNPDIVASFADGISVVRGVGDGTFLPFELYMVPGADFVTSGDVDNDDDVDLLVASATTGDLALLLGDGAGEFLEPFMIFATPSDSLRTAAIVDLDEDGAKELVTVYNYDGAGWVGVFEATP